MSSPKKTRSRKGAFTIVELMTVLSIIIILISLVVPGLNRVRRYSRRVKQKNQFHGIDVAIEMFNSQFEEYPPSDGVDSSGTPLHYCGAMKLCEALMGQDLLGFNPRSQFNATLEDGGGNSLYELSTQNQRVETYFDIENANAYRLNEIYGTGNCVDFAEGLYVLCDVYTNVRGKGAASGDKIGMPILYYKADTAGTVHDANNPDNAANIYDYRDNQELVDLPKPWGDGQDHTMSTTSNSDHDIFLKMITNDKFGSAIKRPYKAKSYILLSAGYDGDYGTSDDIFNFEK